MFGRTTSNIGLILRRIFHFLEFTILFPHVWIEISKIEYQLNKLDEICKKNESNP